MATRQDFTEEEWTALQRGLTGTGYRGMTLDQLLVFQDPIVPVLQYGNPHFIVVRGLTSSGRVDIADPGFGNRTLSVSDFKSIWQGGIGFVVSSAARAISTVR